MSRLRKFGDLIGVIEVSSSFVKFLVFATKNREILTCHEITIRKIDGSEDEEYDPIELWNAVKEAMRIATENLVILEIEPTDIVAIGITNERESTLLWNKKSGEVFNPLCLTANRLNLNNIVEQILARTRNKRNFLRSVTGLPFDVCFSAIKIKWLIENNRAVQECVRRNECCFGNLDSWILWNLTGGIDSGVHCTDVTNASRTMLMDLESLSWDKRLCKFFDIPMNILPQIRSCSEIYGYVTNSNSVLEGVPIASVIGDKNSALVGQNCLKAGQIECHVEDDCSVLLNTGQSIVHSENELLTTVGFQLGPHEKVHYALEGFIGSSCTSIDWLKSSVIAAESNNNEDISPVSNFLGMRNGNCFKRIQENELTFVPALKGLCAPRFLFQAKGFLSGITINTTSQHLLTAAKESICFQTKTILNSIKSDCKMWPPIGSLIVGGEFSENVDFLQILANICSVTIERPQVSAPTGLGCMLSAALTMKSLSLEDFRTTCIPPVDSFYPTINPDSSEQKYMNWLCTLKTSLRVNDNCSREEVNSLLETKDTQRYIMNSIPGCLFLFTSYLIYVFAETR